MILNLAYDTYTAEFSLSGKTLFIGRRERTGLFSFLRLIESVEKERLVDIIETTGNLAWTRKFVIHLKQGDKSEKILVKEHPFKRPHLFSFKNDTYEVIRHAGFKRSIFKNDLQIGYIQEKAKFGKLEVNYTIVFDDDIDLISISTLVFAVICNFWSRETGLTIHTGYVGPEKKKFDVNWEPKSATL